MSRPTSVRYGVLAATACVSLFMYVDRVCLAGVKGDIQKELGIDDVGMQWVLSGFFWSYALAMVFAGAIASRFGARHTLAFYLFLWSFFTCITGLANGFWMLLASRLLVGLTEAGAYPTAAALIKQWFPLKRRGMASSAVAFGGRFGGAGGQQLTPILVALLAGTMMMSGWRLTLILFGVVGMIYAGVFWFFVRNSAKQHPSANDEEADLVEAIPATKSASSLPLRALLSSPNVWLASGVQFGINIGWAFLITNWPDYLEKVHGLTGNDKGNWSSGPLYIGMAGMLVGGFFTDWLTVKLGRRWGRALPIAAALFGCAGAYAFCYFQTDYVPVVIGLCAMAVFVDLGVPAIWAFSQDIGGRHVGPTLGFINMCGNMGAAVCPLLLGFVQREFGWPAVFLTCAVSFLSAAFTALAMNSTIPIEDDSGAVVEG